MPEKRTLQRAAQDKKKGNAPSTQAGEFVREEMDHIREGKHGARNPKQAIAIGLSKARRAGVKLAPPKPGQASERTRKQATRDNAKGQSAKKAAPNPKRSRATTQALKREGHAAASKSALSKHAHQAAAKRASSKRAVTPKPAATKKSPAAKKTAARKSSASRKTARKQSR